MKMVKKSKTSKFGGQAGVAGAINQHKAMAMGKQSAVVGVTKKPGSGSSIPRMKK